MLHFVRGRLDESEFNFWLEEGDLYKKAAKVDLEYYCKELAKFKTSIEQLRVKSLIKKRYFKTGRLFCTIFFYFGNNKKLTLMGHKLWL